MRAGLLDTRAEFYELTTVKNDYNESVESYSLSFKTWAEIIPVRGDIILSSDEKFWSGVMIIKVRYRESIVESMRVKVEENTYRITYIEELGRDEGMKITLSKINE